MTAIDEKLKDRLAVKFDPHIHQLGDVKFYIDAPHFVEPVDQGVEDALILYPAVNAFEQLLSVSISA